MEAQRVEVGGLCLLTFVFFSGLGGSSLLGGAVMSFPVTASAALGSSGFAGKKEEWRLQCEPFLLVWLAGQFFSLLFISITRGNRTETVMGWLFWGKYPQTRTAMGRTSSLLQDEANKRSSNAISIQLLGSWSCRREPLG